MMKKVLFLICTFTMALLSCEGPMGPPGEPGEGMNWKILYYTVRENDWRLVGGSDALNSYYTYEFDEPELTKFIYESGTVVGYRILNSGQSNEMQAQLPYMIPMGESDGYGESLWIENYSFAYGIGVMAFYVDYSDFYTSNRPPTCEFRIVMNW